MPHTTPNYPRRYYLLALLCSACSKHTPGIELQRKRAQAERLGLSEEEQHRFRGIYKGGQLYIDATYETEKRQVVYLPNGDILNIAMQDYSPKKSATIDYYDDEKNNLPVPQNLRYQLFNKDTLKKHQPHLRATIPVGDPILDVTIPVASRIPDEVLNRLRQYQGSHLKLKLRLTPETILVGWEVRNGIGYPYPKDAYGNLTISEEDLMIGGDFCERRVRLRRVDGEFQQVIFQGWQIDPKTGKKIEMDY